MPKWLGFQRKVRRIFLGPTNDLNLGSTNDLNLGPTYWTWVQPNELGQGPTIWTWALATIWTWALPYETWAQPNELGQGPTIWTIGPYERALPNLLGPYLRYELGPYLLSVGLTQWTWARPYNMNDRSLRKGPTIWTWALPNLLGPYLRYQLYFLRVHTRPQLFCLLIRFKELWLGLGLIVKGSLNLKVTGLTNNQSFRSLRPPWLGNFSLDRLSRRSSLST